MARYEQFLLFPQCFKKDLYRRLVKTRLVWERFNSFPNNKNVDLSKSKAFPYNNLDVAPAMELVFDRVKNIVGKGENAGYQHFSFSHNVYKRLNSTLIIVVKSQV